MGTKKEMAEHSPRWFYEKLKSLWAEGREIAQNVDYNDPNSVRDGIRDMRQTPGGIYVLVALCVVAIYAYLFMSKIVFWLISQAITMVGLSFIFFKIYERFYDADSVGVFKRRRLPLDAGIQGAIWQTNYY